MVVILVLALNVRKSESCTAFYCINSCGSSSTSTNKGFKLVVAVNRDEAVDRRTIPAGVWPPKKGPDTPLSGHFVCDQSKLEPPYNLCVYGALDMAVDVPPNYYSTWLGKNLSRVFIIRLRFN